MSPNVRSRLSDLGVVAKIVSITIGLGVIFGATYRLIIWTSGVAKTAEVASALALKADKVELRDHIQAAAEERKVILDEMKTQRTQMADDLKILRQRTWELLQNKRNR